MQKSMFTVEVKLDDEKSMLYNTSSREYYVFGHSKRKDILSLLENINKGECELQEIQIIAEWLEKGIVVNDNETEIVQLLCTENKHRFDNSVVSLMIIVTNDCNFRCTYCVQEHVKCRLSQESIEKIIKFVDKITVGKKILNISWFGGEPTLEFEKIRQMSHRIKQICNANGCNYNANITTNGYLLNEEKSKLLPEMNIRQVQVTLDGDKYSHDQRRILVNGKGTFDVIMDNFKIMLRKDLRLVLRINVDENNILKAHEVLEMIPKEYRNKVIINYCNLFQQKGKNSLYELYRIAINMGFAYINKNQYVSCEAGRINGYVINADANILLCPNASEEDRVIGYLDEEGDIRLKKTEWFYKLRASSNIQKMECRSCSQVPFCLSKCRYKYSENAQSICSFNDGLSLDERARLDYYYITCKGDIG